MTPVRTAVNPTAPFHRYDTHALSRWTPPRSGTDFASASSQKRVLIGTRIPFLLLGGWPDFIPTIATHLWPGAEPNWIVGYAWRYLGNGGGMGLAFTVAYRMTAPRVSVWPLAVGYGVAIWLCLIATLFLMPEGKVLFELTPLTVSISLLGHVVYGAGLAPGLRSASAP